jgi:mRNA interferase MazF
VGRFVKGDIVVLNFPFSNLTGAKRRPALILADLSGDDVILCQITSQPRADNYSIKLEIDDFSDGKLLVESVVRPNKIFTADESIILYKACRVSDERMSDIVTAIIELISN